MKTAYINKKDYKKETGQILWEMDSNDRVIAITGGGYGHNDEFCLRRESLLPHPITGAYVTTPPGTWGWERLYLARSRHRPFKTDYVAGGYNGDILYAKYAHLKQAG